MDFLLYAKAKIHSLSSIEFAAFSLLILLDSFLYEILGALIEWKLELREKVCYASSFS
jgi:hypothetical protein